MSKNYVEQYRNKLISAQGAAQLINSGDYILYGPFLARPIDFDHALAARHNELNDVAIYMAGGTYPPPDTAMIDPAMGAFYHTSFYFTAIDRKLHDNDRMFYLPCHFSQGGVIFARHYYPPYYAVVQVSPMDKNGFFSFGIANTYSYEGCINANHIIVEVNENIPRVPGGSEDVIHISMVNNIIEGSNSPLFELPKPKAASVTDHAMANLLLEEIPDGACLQLGVGSLPNLLGELLCESNLKDLGIHSEMFCDSMMHMFESGLVTNRYKITDRGKAVFTFCLGSKETYEFIENNPFLASHPCSYTNNPRIIGMNPNVVSINNCLEVDLFSQVCAESSGIRQISGSGGQLDFVEGAAVSPGGKSFLCLTSTYTDHQGVVHSRIVPTLKPGSIVTTPRASVEYIVTEYGKAELKAQNTWKRAERLIAIAHPDFQDQLVKEAEEMKIWRRSNRL
ncbi:MAG: acetyl-CoA hydrolase/transferase family protein [Methylocystaceae bacterium]